jgi:hypothetical protein
MRFQPAIPTRGAKVPSSPEWIHEVKFDDFRLIVHRDGDRVRLITRGGYDWTKRYPRITEAAPKVRQGRFVIDGEAVILGVDGVFDFDALHCGKHNEEVQLCAFDILSRAMTICASCRCTCAKQTSNACLPAGPRASSSTRSSAAKLGPTYSAPPATWGWRAWSPSTATGPTRAAGRSTGLR